MDIKKVRRSYDLPENLVFYFKNWKPGRDLSPKVSGAILYYMTLDPDIRDLCEKLAHNEDIEKALDVIQKKSAKIPALPLLPEEKAILMPDKDVELMLKTLLKFKPALVLQTIGQALSGGVAGLENTEELSIVRKNESADTSALAKKKRKSRKRKTSKFA